MRCRCPDFRAVIDWPIDLSDDLGLVSLFALFTMEMMVHPPGRSLYALSPSIFGAISIEQYCAMGYYSIAPT